MRIITAGELDNGVRIGTMANAVRQCRNMQPFRRPKANGETALFLVRCGECWDCEITYQNERVGRIGAELLDCAHAQIWTLTYDDKAGPEARAGANIRIPEHPANFIKRLRQREARKLAKYNRQEEARAEKEKRAPRLVDTSRSYVKYDVWYEYGEDGRGHWHVILLFNSHFPVPDQVVWEGSVKNAMAQAKRVWDLPAIIGTPPETLGAIRKTSEDPEVIDFRVNRNQKHDLWPWGTVNIKSLTHDVRFELNSYQEVVPTAPGQPEMARTKDAGVSLANFLPLEQFKNVVTYAANYDKSAKKKARKEAQEKSELVKKLEAAGFPQEPEKPVKPRRSYSQGMGKRFAQVYGVEHARQGLQMKDFHFHLVGFTFKKNRKKEYKFKQGLRNRGVHETTIDAVSQGQIVYGMRGSMRTAALKAWLGEWQRLELKPPTLEALTKPMVLAMFDKQRKESSEFLRSHDAEMIRLIHDDEAGAFVLPENLDPIDYFERDQEGTELDGLKGRERKIRKPLDRLKEAEKQHQEILAAYEASRPRPRLLGLLKRSVSKVEPENLDTELMYQNRPREPLHKFARPEEGLALEKYLESLGERDDDLATEELEFLEQYLAETRMKEAGFPRHSLWHPDVSQRMLFAWINYEDDYGFPELREKLIQRYCQVKELTWCERVITTPDGRVIKQQLWESKSLAKKECPNTGQILRQRKLERWVSREAKTPEERKAAFAGKFKVEHSESKCEIFKIEEKITPPAVASLRKSQRHGTTGA